MHDQRVRFSQLHERLGDPIWAELSFTTRFFRFAPHGDPDIRVEHVGVARRFLQIFGAKYAPARAPEQFALRLIPLRRGDPQFKVELARSEEPRPCGIGHAVANKRHNLVLDTLSLFLNCENVAQNLAGMFVIG